MKPFPGAASRISDDAADLNILVLSDSTAEADTEWVYLWADTDLAGYTTHTVKYERWDYVGESWEAEETLATGSGSNTIKLWNASGGSYGCDDFTTREAAIIQHPSAVDQVVIALGHNAPYGESDFGSLIDMVQSNWPTAYVTMVVQNPWAESSAHIARWESVRASASTYGLPLVDVGAAFLATSDWETELMADTVHPNSAGHVVYRTTVQAGFVAGGSMVSKAGVSPEWLHRAGRYSGSGLWLDETGNGHNATIVGATFVPASGGNPAYFSLDGNDYMEIPDAAGVRFGASDELTLMVVCTPTAVGTWQEIVWKGANTTTLPAYGIRLASTGQRRGVTIDSTPSVVQDTGANATDDVRTTMTLRLDRTLNEVELFTDGVGSGSPADASSLGSLEEGLSRKLYYGCIQGSAEFFQGTIEAVAGFRSALTDEQRLAWESYLRGEGTTNLTTVLAPAARW